MPALRQNFAAVPETAPVQSESDKVPEAHPVTETSVYRSPAQRGGGKDTQAKATLPHRPPPHSRLRFAPPVLLAVRQPATCSFSTTAPHTTPFPAYSQSSHQDGHTGHYLLTGIPASVLRNDPAEQGNTGGTCLLAGTNNPRAIAAIAGGGLSPAVLWRA
ncbi:hypothetical protein HmCmsJML268_03768 [Escherichia coli]|nr:hypothetical protein HmCmsJML268_03768 [Escherichia coli]